MEYTMWGIYGKSDIQGVENNTVEVFHGEGYKFTFQCLYDLDDLTVQSNYAVDTLSAVPVGLVLPPNNPLISIPTLIC